MLVESVSSVGHAAPPASKGCPAQSNAASMTSSLTNQTNFTANSSNNKTNAHATTAARSNSAQKNHTNDMIGNANDAVHTSPTNTDTSNSAGGVPAILKQNDLALHGHQSSLIKQKGRGVFLERPFQLRRKPSVQS